MIILPDKHAPVGGRALVLMRKDEWRSPSAAQPKDQLGNANQTAFRARAKLHDGHVVWAGWFEDYEDFDAFTEALVRHQMLDDPMPRELWDLPTPAWRPDMGEELSYDFAFQTFLTASPGSNQSFTSLAAWNNASNSIECIGGAGSGGWSGSTSTTTGAGGGAYAKINNFTFAVPGTTAATYQIGAGAVGTPGAPAVPGAQSFPGTAGGDSWFNASTFAGSSVGAKAGLGGSSIFGGGGTGALGGQASACIGTLKYSGGNGGATASASASGGGGAAGPNGAGNPGLPSAANNQSAGGSGDAGFGGAAGAIRSNGGNGTEWDSTHGAGGGGGGQVNLNGVKAGNGGNYGGAGGSANTNSASDAVQGGDGIQGIIAMTSNVSVFGLTQSMLGM